MMAAPCRSTRRSNVLTVWAKGPTVSLRVSPGDTLQHEDVITAFMSPYG
jgi:hypothetical protein